MISTGDLKKGLSLELDGQLYTILDWQHIKLGRGGATVRLKLRNLRTGAIVERTFDAGEKFKRVFLDRVHVMYQYQDGDQYHFMDTTTYEDIVLTEEQLGDARLYLTDNMELDIMMHEGRPISVELPEKVVLRVTYTEPGVKGDTATGGSKPATTETGLVVQVPLFVNIGDLIRVNTTTGEYVERA
ncbi:elongation factor P [Thermogemmatispora sp.]|uniref:Elongation factor P n=1 Tax=Thermogemmatispora argillosa TaxID=2045280 RepID=A0A455T821_9CHLR|nr:elongation factor P [Thermogemmatispora sp.]MBX5449812.1 elongation factor P [Thermogemmatispora sp.]BBH95584.1 elongation factor P [Thermogemmatispora argillosa]